MNVTTSHDVLISDPCGHLCCLAWYTERISVKPQQDALTQPPSAGKEI